MKAQLKALYAPVAEPLDQVRATVRDSGIPGTPYLIRIMGTWEQALTDGMSGPQVMLRFCRK